MNGWDLALLVLGLGIVGVVGYTMGHLRGQSAAFSELHMLLGANDDQGNTVIIHDKSLQDYQA